ncbi:hypothetical protein TRIUR3_12360 [Triticum urartu]|uniref:Uncharacterized protein n=1 Tax=Triticum urartu TaxID=4572 RepID=M7YKM1_TRIUA|nr:hypothetical protein TRIUR3_12360 [Triticum urartu]
MAATGASHPTPLPRPVTLASPTLKLAVVRLLRVAPLIHSLLRTSFLDTRARVDSGADDTSVGDATELKWELDEDLDRCYVSFLNSAHALLFILSNGREGGRWDSFGWALVGELVGRPALPSACGPLGLSSTSCVPVPPVGATPSQHLDPAPGTSLILLDLSHERMILLVGGSATQGILDVPNLKKCGGGRSAWGRRAQLDREGLCSLRADARGQQRHHDVQLRAAHPCPQPLRPTLGVSSKILSRERIIIVNSKLIRCVKR